MKVLKKPPSKCCHMSADAMQICHVSNSCADMLACPSGICVPPAVTFYAFICVYNSLPECCHMQFYSLALRLVLQAAMFSHRRCPPWKEQGRFDRSLQRQAKPQRCYLRRQSGCGSAAIPHCLAPACSSNMLCWPAACSSCEVVYGSSCLCM